MEAVLPDAVRFRLDMWLAMHEDQRSVPRVRVLFDRLAEAMDAYARESRFEAAAV